LIRQGRKTR